MGAAKNTTPNVPSPRQKKPWRKTPLVESTNLSKAAGCFKSRGLGNLVVQSMERAQDPEKVHFYSSSGGNAGLGAVFAANFVGRPSTVVVPMSTKPHMIAKIRAAGATQVLQHGASIKDAEAYMKSIVMEEAWKRGEEPVFISPFDHQDIWDGHATMVDEMRDQFEDLDETPPEYVVCSCGGGGLFVGISQGIENQGDAWEKTKIMTVNTVGADALPISLEQGENIMLEKITSIATSLGVVRAADRAFELAQQGHATGKVKSVVLSDAEAAMGCWRLAEDERILVEPACGVNVALCYGNRLKKALGRPVRPDDKVVLVICGGSNVSATMIEQWKQEYGDLDVGVNGNGQVPSATLAPNVDVEDVDMNGNHIPTATLAPAVQCC